MIAMRTKYLSKLFTVRHSRAQQQSDAGLSGPGGRLCKYLCSQQLSAFQHYLGWIGPSRVSVCKICLAEDVLASCAVRFAFSGPNATLEAYACERCLSSGRLTKVTCRNFLRA